MPIFDGNLPYTNIHELNLDWLIKTVAQIKDSWEKFTYSVSANAVQGFPTNVTVTGDLETGLHFTFTIPAGQDGAQGIQGPIGPEGVGIDDAEITPNGRLIFHLTDGSYLPVSGATVIGPQGEGLQILGKYADLTALQYAHPTGTAGEMYLVGLTDPYELYIWDDDTNDWVSGGTISSPSRATTNPLMDGVASKGVSSEYARADHVHPTDTSKCSLQQVYPVGSLYFNASYDTNPATLFGFGTWVRLKDRFILGAGDNHPAGETGGEETATLTVPNLPNQQGLIEFHGNGGTRAGTEVWGVSGVFSKEKPIANNYRQGSRYSGYPSVGNVKYDNEGESQPFSIMPPYMAIYVWVRTA